MRGLYIFAVLLVAAQLSACGDWHNLPNIKNRNSLANRVGNYGPARLDSDESARQASGRITPLKWKDDAKLDDREVLAAQKSNLKDVHVTCTAIVRKILPDDRVTSPHERFLLELSNGSTVLVAHNISLAPYILLHEGDRVT